MIVALNNKCNLEKQEYESYITELNNINCQSKLIICPTFLNLGNTNNCNFSLGAQNVGINSTGAFTGEIGASQLKSYNAEYCIVGHSERREYQKETLSEINTKIKNLFVKDITPILCIGETKEQRDNNQVKEILEKEITTAIEGLTFEEKNKLIIAYEPIWSIGTGIIPTLKEIKEIFTFIKTLLPTSKVLYGGSANENNIDTLKTEPLIDGYLLGGLSLKPIELKIFLDKLEN